jgi:adenylylsulfate kinase
LAEGKGMGFTGVDDPYEQPLSAEIVIRNDRTTPQEAAAQVIAYMESRGMLPDASRGVDSPRRHVNV